MRRGGVLCRPRVGTVLSAGTEPRRERPRSARPHLTPRPVQGSFTSRFRVPSSEMTCRGGCVPICRPSPRHERARRRTVLSARSSPELRPGSADGCRFSGHRVLRTLMSCVQQPLCKARSFGSSSRRHSRERTGRTGPDDVRKQSGCVCRSQATRGCIASCQGAAIQFPIEPCRPVVAGDAAAVVCGRTHITVLNVGSVDALHFRDAQQLSEHPTVNRIAVACEPLHVTAPSTANRIHL